MSKVKFTVGDWVRVEGTSKRGEIMASYADIVSVFGEPTFTRGPDSYVEWDIEFEVPDAWEEDGVKEVIATIYDHGFNIDPSQRPHEEFRFTIGGDSMDSSYYVHQLLGK